MKKVLLGLFSGFMVIIFILPFARDFETHELNDSVRESLGVNSLNLEDGAVAYELKNDKVFRQTVVFVHGFSTPSYIWEPSYQYFKEQGYRVLRFDLFGRGFSDRPEADYSIDLYVAQLTQLLDRLSINEPVHLVGLSMGGPITTRFTHQNPNRVRSLSLLAPLVETPDRADLALIKTPLVGEYLATVMMMPQVANGLARAVFDPNVYPKWDENMQKHIHFKGYRKALLATARYLAAKSFVEDYRSLGQSKVPVQLIWGQNDGVVKFEQSALIQQAIPGIPLHALEECGHLPQIEHPGKVNEQLFVFTQTHGV